MKSVSQRVTRKQEAAQAAAASGKDSKMKKIYNEGEKFATKLKTDTLVKKKDNKAINPE